MNNVVNASSFNKNYRSCTLKLFLSSQKLWVEDNFLQALVWSSIF